MKTIKETTNRLKAVALILMFPLALGLVGAASCSKKENDRSNDPIVGTWQMRSFLAETTITIEGMTGTMTLVGRDLDGVRITFNADGTSNSSGSYTMDITTIIAGESTTTSVTANPTLANGGTWKRRGNTLTTDHPENPLGPQEITIAALDDTALHLSDALPPPVPAPGLSNIIADIWFTRVD